MSSPNPHSARAVQMLLLGTALWALSFPSVKAIAAAQEALVPGANSWFLAALCVLYRFASAALLLALLTARTLPKLTRSELWQGLGLGLFGGAGILLQVDGLTYTFASTSAFLTQCYCLLIPIWVALCHRRWPAGKIFVSCALVVIGVAILVGVDWRNFRLGRGEWETLAASVAFTGQILWLERPKFAGNNVSHFSIVMFVTMALVCLPVVLMKSPSAGAWITAFSTGPMIGFLAILVFPCTLGAYMLMNHWQRHVPATHAGLIYCVEPVFTSLYALFLPGWFSAWAGVTYPNEMLTRSLLLGGGLITFANVLICLPSRRPKAAPLVGAVRGELKS